MARHAPWMKFYPSDWRADPALRTCSLAARGLWVEMLAVMHEAEPYGHLLINGQKPTWAMIATLAGAPSQTVQAAVQELKQAGVFSLTDTGIIFSRRMVRDFEKANRDKANGARGGNPNISNGVNPPVNPKTPRGVNPEDKAQKPEARSQKEPSLRSGSPRSRKTLIAADATISEAGIAYAAKEGVVNGSVGRLFEEFRDYHVARETKFADWEAAWRSWVRKRDQFAAPARQPQSKPSPLDAIDRVFGAKP